MKKDFIMKKSNHSGLLKLTVALIFASSLPLTVIAAGVAASSERSFNGWFAGAALGGGLCDFTLSTNHSDRYPNYWTQYTGEHMFSSDRDSSSVIEATAFGNLHVGYGRVFKRLYLGASILGTFFDGKASPSDASEKYYTPNFTFPNGKPLDDQASVMTQGSDLGLKLNNAEFDIDGRLGVLLTNRLLLNTIVGVAFNRVQLKGVSKFAYVHPKLDSTNPNAGWRQAATTLNINRKKSVAGLRLGAQLTGFITSHIAVGMEYIYTYYGKVSGTASGDLIEVKPDGSYFPNPEHPDPYPISTSISKKVMTHQIMLSLDYFI